MAYKQGLISLLLILTIALINISCDSYNQERKEAVICFTFDDGHLNAYENAFPLFKQYEFEATTFINSGRIGQTNFVTWEQVLDLYHNGWEIGGHTLNHVQLTELDDAEAYFQISQDYYNFTDQGIKLKSFALPSGHASERDYEFIKEFYQNIRNSIDKEMHQPLNSLDLGYFAYQTQHKPEFVKQRISRGLAKGEDLIIIGFHRIGDQDANAECNCKTEDLEEILSWIKEKNYPVLRLDKAVKKINNM